ncbi:major outer membrane protein [Campylobacter coli]|nr:major outer membrane protein [Campylobacter coli]EAI6609165.1 major outer membrane protein [Campylobacter coli]EAJ5675706.1 major outer membrane protein [Campylobacter coli]EAL2174709.1 major outer membrane protein [Campylobacter coli]EAL3702872.1 major outer membrane protein [Campylobacter coli]
MKLVKLSLVAALAAGAFSVANATPLEEAIKDIDVSGVLRYRYDTGRFGDRGYGFQDQRSSINDRQNHNYRAQVNLSTAIADNFKAFVQFNYSAKDGGYGADSVSNTSNTFSVRQLYLTYTNEDVATSVILGKQQLNTIWTDNGIDGLVGTGVKVVNNSIDGLTLAAFAVDSFNTDTEGDILASSKLFNSATTNPAGAPQDGTLLNVNPYAGNLYGAAAIGSYEVLGGQLNPQLWLSYLNDTGFFYALDVAYSTTIFDGINWTLKGTYLGNSLDSKMKSKDTIIATKYVGGVGTDVTGEEAMANGNLFALKGAIEVNGWDASLGGIYYGKKDKLTFNTLEDVGNLDLAGAEIFYTDGSNLNGDIGRNIFGYVTAGYTFNETVRVGADLVYGGTKTMDNSGGEKLEAVARVSYKYSPKLNFSAFYSYVNVSNDNQGQEDGRKNTVRLQALYKF